jgi:hypothetical protein
VLQGELALTGEQIGQRERPFRSFEPVLLLDFHHRKQTATGVQRVPGPGRLLLLDQQFLAREQPLVPRHDFRQPVLTHTDLTNRQRQTHRRAGADAMAAGVIADHSRCPGLQAAGRNVTSVIQPS